MNKYNCNCNKSYPCGCNKPDIVGCKNKVDLLCTNYTGVPLTTIDVEAGLDGNSVIKAINDYLEELPNPEDPDILMDNVGGQVEIYKGINLGTFIHEFKTLRGIDGVIVRDSNNLSDCDNDGKVVDILIDKNWLTAFLNQWIQTVNLCPLIQGCTTPLEPGNNPTVTAIVKSLANRATYTFTDLDFLSHYIDLDGHPLNSITITGNTLGYKYNGLSLVSGTEITLFDISSGALTYTGDDTNIAYNKTVIYKAKDSSGAFSNESTITFNVTEKTLIVFNTPTVNLTRGISNTKTSSITFSNGTGQNIPNGYVFINQGTVGQPGHLRITSTAQVVATGIGSIPIQIVSTPTATQSNQVVTYTYDGSNGGVNLTYMSIPVVNNDIVKNVDYMQVASFSNTDFTSNSSDFDGDIVEARILPQTSTGDFSSLIGYKYNGIDYTGEWISVNNLVNISYIPDNITTGYTKINKWQVKDSQGNIST